MNKIYKKTVEKQELQSDSRQMTIQRLKLSAKIKSNSQKVFTLQKEIDELILNNNSN